MNSLSTSFPSQVRLVAASPRWPELAPSLALPPDLRRTDIGDRIVDHATSWVRRLHGGGATVYAKTYEFATWRQRLTRLWRWTGPFVKSRAHREFEALVWLQRAGFAAPEPLAVLELRSWGCLVRATLVTTAYPGERADHALARLPADRQVLLATAIGRFVAALHHQGFRDGNLDLRNLLVLEQGLTFSVAKLDSGRYRLCAPGPASDRRARADWARLLPQLPGELAAHARAARE